MKCGHCKGTHDTIAEVRACAPMGTTVEATFDELGSDFLGLNQKRQPTGPMLDFAHNLLREREPYGNVQDAENTGGIAAGHEVVSSFDYDACKTFISKMKDRPYREHRSRPGKIYVEEGFYLHEHEYYKVQRAVHGSGHLYAKRFVVPTGGGGEPFWEMAAGAVSALRPEERLSQEQAAEFGHLYGMCIRCGRTLTDETSIAAGIGPICAGKEGWL